ncbi:MAG: hypothetical protein WAN46_04585 [Gammaproteobacteria bacterium]
MTYRIVKPGGMAVVTDLDSHNHDFLRIEHNDRWMGFDRTNIKRWFTEAGFDEVMVNCVGETCDSASKCSGEMARISVFVSWGRKPANTALT